MTNNPHLAFLAQILSSPQSPEAGHQNIHSALSDNSLQYGSFAPSYDLKHFPGYLVSPAAGAAQTKLNPGMLQLLQAILGHDFRKPSGGAAGNMPVYADGYGPQYGGPYSQTTK